MAYNKDIVEKLSLFNNISFTKKQWEIVLKGCGCPKSVFFWNALKENNILKVNKNYTLININNTTFPTIWERYCTTNRNNGKQYYNRKIARKKAREKVEHFTGITFYMVGGTLSTEIPEKE